MSVHLRVVDAATEPRLLWAAGVTAIDAVPLRTTRNGRGGPGAHREPGSTPWRTGLREVVAMLTHGRLEIYRPVTRARLRL